MSIIDTFKATIIAQMADGKYYRRRELAWHCGCWVASPDLTVAICELRAEGKIGRKFHSDPANCDSYWEYYLI